jgi:O-methyltransferase
VLLASVLLHTRSPVTLLESCARLVTDSVIVTDLSFPAIGDGPVCSLVPSVENEAWDTWWRFSPSFFTQYLGVLGFPESQVTFHQQSAFRNSLDMFTVVASRNS